jgi:adenylate cyclase
MERKLAAILAADVAGYSRLMGADEEGTLTALRSHREVVDGLIAAHHGRVLNSARDSIVAEHELAELRQMGFPEN